MKKNYFVVAVAVSVIVPILTSCGRARGGFESCIIDNVKAGMAEPAISALKEACRNKFPEEIYKVPPSDLLFLNGRFSINSFGGVGVVYNGSERWALRSVTIKIAINPAIQ